MKHDAKRATGRDAGGERHAIGVTRMCLRSGSVQLPFALAGRLPEGELLVHDVESDEAVVLWSDPPRRLAGLGPLFERHEVQVNDQLVLDLHGDDVRLSVAKRPRRSRPKVTPSAWSSHRDEPPSRPAGREPDDATSLPTEDAEDADAANDAAADAGGGTAPAASGRRRDADRSGARPVAPDEASSAATAAGPVGVDDEDMPRAPRVKVRPVAGGGDPADGGRPGPSGEGPGATPDERAVARDEADRGRGGPFSGLMRAARGLFGGSAERRRARRAEPTEPDDEPDWLHAWDAGPDEPDEATDAFRPPSDDVAAAIDWIPSDPDAGRHAQPELEPDLERGLERDVEPDVEPDREPHREPHREPDLEPRRSRAREPSDDEPAPPASASRSGDTRDGPASEVGAAAPLWPDLAVERSDPPARDRDAAVGPAEVGGTDSRHPPDDERSPNTDPAPELDEQLDEELDDEHVPDASRASDVEPAAARPATGANGPTLPSGVPLRAERFLGGDLRTRLLRFLSSPDMPLIAKTELIAKRFDLDPATARDMLEDVADDPPDGLRLTPVREGAWRIERTGG